MEAFGMGRDSRKHVGRVLAGNAGFEDRVGSRGGFLPGPAQRVELLHRTGRNVGLCSPARERRDLQHSRRSRGGLQRSCFLAVEM
jgi:hypothetical protein